RPPTERQTQRVQQYRLAGTGFAGQHAKAGTKAESEAIDQRDIADGQTEQHCGDDTSASAAKPAPSACSPAASARNLQEVDIYPLHICGGPPPLENDMIYDANLTNLCLEAANDRKQT